MGDMKEIIHCLTYLVKAMYAGRLVNTLQYDDAQGIVTIVYKNGLQKDVDIHWMNSDRAVVKKILKAI
ncbi:MAG: hypothetical protein PHQ72_12140 [Hespellia sp.]|nr:hypothetical protein [Hespellia sp.]